MPVLASARDTHRDEVWDFLGVCVCDRELRAEQRGRVPRFMLRFMQKAMYTIMGMVNVYVYVLLTFLKYVHEFIERKDFEHCKK